MMSTDTLNIPDDAALTPADRIEERRSQVARLYLGGLMLTEIADRLNIGITAVKGDIAALKQRWQRESLELIGEWYGRDLAVLDAIEGEIARIVTDLLGTAKGVELDRIIPWHASRLKVLERRAKLLGYDKMETPPITNQQLNINVVSDGNPGDAAIRELQSLVMAVAASRTEDGGAAKALQSGSREPAR